MRRRLQRAAPWLGALLVAAVQYRFLFAGLVQCSRDLYGQHFSETWFLLQRLREGALPLWLPNERMGQPFLALLYTEVLYPPRALFAWLTDEVRGPNVLHAFHAVFAFAGSFLAARRLGLGRAAAFVSAAPFALGPAFVVFAQNLQFAAGAAWAGWTLWAALRVRATRTLRAMAVLALTVTGCVLAGAPEMVVWQAAMVVLVCGWRGAVGLAWGLLASAVVLLPAAELAREFTDPGAAPSGQLEWSASVAQLVSFGLPDADRPRLGEIWGGDDQWFWASLFAGTATVILAAAGVPRRRARPLMILALLCAVLALGKNFIVAQWLLQLPGLRAFRYPAKYAVGALFAVSMLSGVGVSRLQASIRAEKNRWVFAAAVMGVAIGLVIASRVLPVRAGFTTGAVWGLCIAALVCAAIVIERRASPAPAVTRHWVIVAAVLIVFFGLVIITRAPSAGVGFTIAAGLAGGAVALQRGALSRAGTLCGVVILEVLVSPRQPLVLCDAEGLKAPSPIAAALRAEGAQRVSIWVDRDDDEVPWCEPTDANVVVRTSKRRLSTLRFVEEGVHAVGGYGFRDPWRLARAFEQGRAAYALAGVSHWVLNTWESPPFAGPTPQLTDVDDIWVWKWESAFERSWFVPGARQATDEEALAALAGPVERFRSEVLTPSRVTDADPTMTPGCTATVALTEPAPETIIEQVDLCQSGYLVLADAWYPGWEVTIDDAPATAFRADYFLRGVSVPRGHHSVTWQYRPWSFRIGALLSLMAFLGLAVAYRSRATTGRR